MRITLPSAGVLCGLTALLLLGCQDEPAVRRYQVPKPDTTLAAPPKVRLLAAIVPHGEKTWFFKLTGPTAVVNEHEEAFTRFLQSVRITEQADNPITWTVPTGWRQEASRPGRQATFRMGPTEHFAELSIIALGREAGSLLANVNRWRNLDVGLKPITEESLELVTKKVTIDGSEATLVDMAGPGAPKKTGMGRP